MRKKRFNQIHTRYKYEKETNAFLIEVGLDKYADIYDEWDSSPFKKRDIEEGFSEFISVSASEIPKEFPMVVVLYLPKEVKDELKENTVKTAYENYYLYEAAKVKREWGELRRKTLFYFIYSFILLGVGYFYMSETDNIMINVLREGIFIGGWVFLWEVVTNIFINRRVFTNKINLYKRIYLSEVRFIYH